MNETAQAAAPTFEEVNAIFSRLVIKASRVARQMGLEAPANLRWEYNYRLRTSAGRCRNTSVSVGCEVLWDSVVELHPFFFCDPDGIEQTIAHEIAHAFTPTHKHGPVWTEFFAKMGFTPHRCHRNEAVIAGRGKRESSLRADVSCDCEKTRVRVKMDYRDDPRVPSEYRVYTCRACSKDMTHRELCDKMDEIRDELKCECACGCGRVMLKGSASILDERTIGVPESMFGPYAPGCYTRKLKSLVRSWG